MSAHLYITSSCVINSHQVFKNQELLFENNNAPEWPLTIYQHFGFNYPKFYKMDNLSKLGWLAAELTMNGDITARYRAEDIGIVLANKNSSLDTDIKYFETVKTVPSPALFVYTLPNIVLGEISIRHKLKGENALFVFEKFDAGFIQRYVQTLFETNAVQACICGWIDFLKETCEAVICLVEKNTNESSRPAFTEENINNLYQLKNG